tara:strand:+ start:319 stop:516 length:198 start_codon:yes stop_codon:yes gene_type:complete
MIHILIGGHYMPLTEKSTPAICPECNEAMRRQLGDKSIALNPSIFWFCISITCRDGKKNKVFHGG